MKRITAALIAHQKMLQGGFLSATQIGEYSDHFHPSNQVIDLMRHQLNLPVVNLGKGDDGLTYYGYDEDDCIALQEDPESVKQRVRNQNVIKRNQRLIHNVEKAIKELGIDEVSAVVKSAALNEVFSPR
ncbi:hypothetical protein [Photobacterium phosphoreum]|uniref:hypothetical protein n=1 Tax=Photobacterium phosphoreum TaxID=659 RepID=UPI001E6231E9|nr:hypothetical protein [Photobacterium phosphoreum]MCD9473348.1 hypothetical protein [Photobacterium phosphoreum]MCF2174174.1 hypothetical protein [Photobacterium phosphoreum]